MPVTSITRVSTAADGTQGNGSSYHSVFSPDGARVAFSSGASNLVVGDTNGVDDIFVKDLASGAIVRISTGAGGTQGNGECRSPVFSPDGSKVAFQSDASNLVASDTNGSTDIFVKTLATGAIERISTDVNGAQGNAASSQPVFSPDGTKVAFGSYASNLVAGDSNGKGDVFVKTLATGVIERVSTAADGTQGNGSLYVISLPVFSPDGSKVAFESDASNLVAGDTNSNGDIFVKNLATGAIERVSADVSGAQGNSNSIHPVFSPDGSKVAFQSWASNLVAGDTNNRIDIFVKNLATGAISLVSTAADGTQGTGGDFGSLRPRFSPDGTKVAFHSDASNLVAGDTNGVADAFVKTLATGAIERVSTAANGVQGNGWSVFSDFSPDGTKVVIDSSASNLVAGDTNGTGDIFVVALGGCVADDTANDLRPCADTLPPYFTEVIYGLGGDDTLAGGWGGDILDGGEGGETKGDTVDYAYESGHAPPTQGAEVRLSLGWAVDQYGFTDNVWNIENIVGTNNASFKDVLVGDESANRIEGLAGADTIYAGRGADVMLGGEGDDTLVWVAGDGRDTSIDGGAGNDQLWVFTDSSRPFDGLPAFFAPFLDAPGPVGVEVISGTSGPFEIRGSDGPDEWYFYSLASNATTINGAGGNDTIVGRHGGSDALPGSPAAETILGGNGNDLLESGRFLASSQSGSDLLAGGAGNDTLYGYDGNDTLIGGPGSDEIVSGKFNIGYGGNKYMVGGPGADDFYIAGGYNSLYGLSLPGTKRELIYDFEGAGNGGGDYISLQPRDRFSIIEVEEVTPSGIFTQAFKIIDPGEFVHIIEIYSVNGQLLGPGDASFL
ncbi:MAG: hypothetical protein WAS73_05975 [Defluviicoccus sp.]